MQPVEFHDALDLLELHITVAIESAEADRVRSAVWDLHRTSKMAAPTDPLHARFRERAMRVHGQASTIFGELSNRARLHGKEASFNARIARATTLEVLIEMLPEARHVLMARSATREYRTEETRDLAYIYRRCAFVRSMIIKRRGGQLMLSGLVPEPNQMPHVAHWPELAEMTLPAFLHAVAVGSRTIRQPEIVPQIRMTVTPFTVDPRTGTMHRRVFNIEDQAEMRAAGMAT